MAYKVYRYNNYFVVIDRGNYFEEHCENVLVTKKKGTDSVYTIAFLAQNTERATAVSQSFPNISFSDIRDEFDAPYGSITIWEDWYTKNTGVGYITTLLAASGLATEATLLQVLNNMIASQDIEILLVRDTGNADQVIQQIREYDQGTGVWNTRYEDVTGTTYVPVGPLEYLDPSAVLNLMLTELLDQGLTLDQLQTNTTGLNLEVTQLLIKGVLDTLLANFNAEDFATETTLALIEDVIDNMTFTGGDLNVSANIQVGGTDVSNANPVPISDAGGSITVDGTIAATQSGTWNINNITGTVSLPTGAATESTLSTLNSQFTAVTRTPALIRATGSGTIAAGARSISVFNAGSAAGSILGVAGNILPGEVFEFSAGGENDTLSAFAYNGTGTTLVITSIV